MDRYRRNSIKNGRNRGAAWLAVSLCGLAACSGKEPLPTPLVGLLVDRVKADLTKPDPGAAYWREAPEGIVSLLAQPMMAPRPETTATEQVFVKAVRNDTQAAFRIRWKDPEISEAGRLGEFSDAMAIEFPIQTKPLPPVMMGAKDNPVHIFHWRAQYQRDREKGKPSMKDLYPNHSIDIYPMEFREAKGGTATDQEKFSPGLAEGNPQSYEKTGVDEIIAEGFSTSSVRAVSPLVSGHADWKDGEWSLVITRSLDVEGGSSLRVGVPNFIGFAAWQGGQGEVGSRKSVSMNWTPVTVR